jgi:hypothetical protein
MTATETTEEQMTKTRRKQCSTKGCRKGRADGSDLCPECLAAASSGGNGVDATASEGETVFPEDEVMKLTSAELDRFNLLRLKVEHKLQAIRVLELEQDRADREYVSQKHGRSQLIAQHRAEVEPLNNEYFAFTREIAKRYKLQPDKMGIEDDTGVLRDLRPPKEEVEPG